MRFSGFSALNPRAHLLISPRALELLRRSSVDLPPSWAEIPPDRPCPELPAKALPVRVVLADESPADGAGATISLLPPTTEDLSSLSRWAVLGQRLQGLLLFGRAQCPRTGLWYTQRNTPDRMRFTLWLVCLVVLLLFTGRFLPMDDGLRHPLAYLFDYDYTRLFPYWILDLHKSPNILFEAVAGGIHQALGWFGASAQEYAATVVALGGFVLLCAAFCAHLPRGNSALRALFLALCLTGLLGRPYLGRPTTYLVGAFLLAIHPWTIARWWRVACVGAFCGALYWIWFVYFPPLGLFHPLYWALAIPTHFAWDAYLDHGFWGTIRQLHEAVYGATGASLMPVGENLGLLNLRPFPMALLAMALWQFLRTWPATWRRRPARSQTQSFGRDLYRWALDAVREHRLFLAMLWFMAPNQLRYLEFFLPLAILYARPLWETILTRGLPHTLWRVVLAYTLVYAFSFSLAQGRSLRLVHEMRPPEDLMARLEGQRVLSANAYVLFPLFYFGYPQHRFFPSAFDPRFNPVEVARAVSDTLHLSRRGPTQSLPPCDVYDRYPFDYYVARNVDTFAFPVPACYRLEGVYGSVSVWRILAAEDAGPPDGSPAPAPGGNDTGPR